MAGDFLPPINVGIVRADTAREDRREAAREEARQEARQATEQFRQACDATRSAPTRDDFARLRAMFRQEFYTERGLRQSDINKVFTEVFPSARLEDTGVHDPANQDPNPAATDQKATPSPSEAAKSGDARSDAQSRGDAFLRDDPRALKPQQAGTSSQNSHQQNQQKAPPPKAPLPQATATPPPPLPGAAQKAQALPLPVPQKGALFQAPSTTPGVPMSVPGAPLIPGQPLPAGTSPDQAQPAQPGVKFLCMGEPSKPGTGHSPDVLAAHHEAGANFRNFMNGTSGLVPVPVPMPTPATNGETVLGRLYRQATSSKVGSKGSRDSDKSGAVSDRELALGFRRSMGRC